ncbi:MAG: hypothetical protein RIE08_16255 [Acidimicrobiales bacterium]
MESFAFTTVASRIHDTSSIDRVTEPVRKLFDQLGAAAVPTPEAAGDTPLLILVATGGTERAVLGVVETRRHHVPFEPAVLVAHPSHNSLPAAMEASAALTQRGIPSRILYAGGPDTLDRIAETVTDLTTIHRLHRTRLGAVGDASEWLVASSPPAHLVRSRWGVEMVPIDVASVVEHHRDTTRPDDGSVAVAFGRSRHDDLREGAIETAARVHPALEAAIRDANVDAVTVRCFDLLEDLATSGCLALAALNDAGVVAGCEGDVPAALAMLLVRHLLDRPSWIANPAQVDIREDRLVLAHCTVAPSLVDDQSLSTHFESGIGVGISGVFASGPATIIRIGGSRLDRMWCSDVDIVATGDSPDLCRTQATVQLVDRHVTELLDAPLGNHMVLALGHHRKRIERWWRFAFGSEPTT